MQSVVRLAMASTISRYWGGCRKQWKIFDNVSFPYWDTAGIVSTSWILLVQPPIFLSKNYSTEEAGGMDSTECKSFCDWATLKNLETEWNVSLHEEGVLANWQVYSPVRLQSFPFTISREWCFSSSCFSFRTLRLPLTWAKKELNSNNGGNCSRLAERLSAKVCLYWVIFSAWSSDYDFSWFQSCYCISNIWKPYPTPIRFETYLYNSDNWDDFQDSCGMYEVLFAHFCCTSTPDGERNRPIWVLSVVWEVCRKSAQEMKRISWT